MTEQILLFAFGVGCAWVLLRSLRWLPLVFFVCSASGFTITIQNSGTVDVWGTCYYSNDHGTNWSQWFVLNAANNGQNSGAYTMQASQYYKVSWWTDSGRSSLLRTIVYEHPWTINIVDDPNYSGGPTYTNSYVDELCVTNNSSVPGGGYLLGMPAEWYVCIDGGPPQLVHSAVIPWSVGEVYCYTPPNLTDGRHYTCFYVRYWANDDWQQKDGTIHDENPALPPSDDPETVTGDGSDSPSDNYDGGSTNSPPNQDATIKGLAELLGELRKKANERTLRDFTNQVGEDNEQIKGKLASTTNLLSEIKGGMTNVAQEATLKSVTNLLGGMSNLMSAEAAGLGASLTNWGSASNGIASDGLAASNAWRSAFAGAQSVLQATNFSATAHPEFWRIPMRTNIHGSVTYVSLNPRDSRLWTLAPWVRLVFTWLLIVGTIWFLFNELRDKLVQVLQIPGGGLLRVLANAWAYLVGSTVTGALGISVVIALVMSFPAVVSYVISPVTAFWNYPDLLTEAAFSLTGEWAPYLTECVHLVNEWFPIALAFALAVWRFIACLIMDGVLLFAGFLIRGIV